MKFRNNTLFSLITLMLLCGMVLDTMAASAGRIDTDFYSDGYLQNIPEFKYNDSIQTTNGTYWVGFDTSNPNNKELRINWSNENKTGSITSRVIDIGGQDTAYAIAEQLDGKLVVTGDVSNSSGASDIFVARFNPNLSLDTSFGINGVAVTDINNQSSVGFDIAVIDGKIVVCGRLLAATTDAVFVRYNSNGSLDTSFDGDGIKIVDIGGTNLALSLAPADSNKIVATGNAGSSLAVYKLNIDGTMDTTFDLDGIALLSLPNGSARGLSVRYVLSTGSISQKILVAGWAANERSTAMARYNLNGSLDTTFGNGGTVVRDFFPGVNESLTDLLFISGNIYSAFQSTNGGAGVVSYDFVTGASNNSFGNDGMVRYPSTDSNCTSITLGRDSSGVSLFLTTGSSDSAKNGLIKLALNPKPTQSNDFDGDGFSDQVIFRPSTANWFILRSSDQTVDIKSFGTNGDVPIDADFDGDGISDLAIFRPSSSQWWFQRSSNGTTFATQFGAANDKPVPGDYDKDGKSDIAIWRPSTGNYLIARSSDNFGSFYGFQFGANGDIPVGTAIYP